MPAYTIVDTKLIDPAAYEEYKAKARPIAERHGGRYLARGGKLDIVEAGLWHPSRIVIIEFPSMAHARAFADDPDYQPIAQIRRANAEATIVIVEGM
ncbi:MAG: DUF1330 domain-containing protein [Pseudomonadota bacterium]